MATGDIATIIVVGVMIGSVLITRKGGSKNWRWPWSKPNKCPKCKSDKVLRIEYGMPVTDTPEGVYEGGCCVTGHDPKWHCASCHWQWGNGSKGAYCEDDIE